MNYDDKQPMHNGSEIGLIDMGLINSAEPKEYRNLSRKQLIDRIMRLESFGRSGAFSHLMEIPVEFLPLSFTSSKALGEMFGITSCQARTVITGFHKTERHKKAVETATHVFNLDGTVRMEMTEKLRADMLEAKKR